MANHIRFVTLDVFTSQAYSGNPLGVVFLPDENNSQIPALTQRQKQTIAQEFNLSETIFVYPGEGETRTIDIFTTDMELPFAGHPTIGAASWFLSLGETSSPVNRLITKSGEIPIAVQQSGPSRGGGVVAKIAHNVHLHSAKFPLRELLRLHPSLSPFFPADAEGAEAVSFPVFSIVRGMTQIHVQLPSLEALAAVTTSAGGELVTADSGYLDEEWATGLALVYFYVRDVENSETGASVIRTRSIVGNLEDPATGSAASGLAAYLTLKGGQKGPHKYDIVQGVEMGRRSVIGVGVTVNEQGLIDTVELKGSAVKVSEGSILVPRRDHE
ncbi:putative phenazine biosynthesis-like protein [Aspergillus taichungensis]|uniref:Putative phenazine biosynthesis-like protein n=1 Tax=Aspergillus taichungensis TaxID=482145 RepID=A0A2J5HUZ4_9EURO|nr:putative phenazine biosynthesis-like protein [Aspergillus taichungensis]